MFGFNDEDGYRYCTFYCENCKGTHTIAIDSPLKCVDDLNMNGCPFCSNGERVENKRIQVLNFMKKQEELSYSLTAEYFTKAVTF